VKVGEFAKTKAPEPVSSVTAVARLADEGVLHQEAIPEARDVMIFPKKEKLEPTDKLVELAVVEKKLVEVALVVVPLPKIKF